MGRAACSTNWSSRRRRSTPTRSGSAGGDLSAVTTRQLRDAIAILEAKSTPAETDAYKVFVMTVAQAVASAHKEGGFLGIGGKQVSDAENQALDEISSALGAPPAPTVDR